MSTFTQHDVVGSQEWGATSVYDYVRLITSNVSTVEITLPDASLVLGRRYTFGNVGTADAYLNPADGTSDTVLGSTATYTVVPSAVFTIQAVQIRTSAYGWELVG